MKYFRMSYEEVVFKRSYANIMLLNRSIPSFNFDKDKDGEYSEDAIITTDKNIKNDHDFFMGFM